MLISCSSIWDQILQEALIFISELSKHEIKCPGENHHFKDQKHFNFWNTAAFNKQYSSYNRNNFETLRALKNEVKYPNTSGLQPDVLKAIRKIYQT